jgi:hypothetical protein
MFGRRSTGHGQQRGALSKSNLGKAAIAGVGMLALRWWRNRQTRASRMAAPTSSTRAGQNNWP